MKVESTAAKVEEVVTRWVSDGFCRAEEILILSPHGTIRKTSLVGGSKIGEWPLNSFTARRPGELSLLSINKAKGLDSLAVIMMTYRALTNSPPRKNRWTIYGSEPSPPIAGDYS
jgi:hypothetical protein